ncbi:flavodoxin domain-containing protein [Haloarcula salina]|uniref:Flavodoxin domain-containing protein n=1 Tax=Haloarcula salina TaxID=1429914 RepID=A0AA41G3W5_9EURY|nr:flavodoxin domain-containing protein [Haloarcula salina]MBV0903169.1 flavodoxin domain-containing protein [Haloarcula salina]
MASILVCYGTGEGQTAKVADRIAEVIDERGHSVTTVDAADPPADLAVGQFDAVAVGASIHMGAHQDSVREFVTEYRAALSDRPTAFFQLSMSSATDDEERRAEAAGYVESFLDSTGWHPDRIGLFGGALRYSEYGFLKRLIMKRIAAEATGDVDTDRDYEYTDWHEVEAFAADFAAFVEGRLGVAVPESSDDAP